jgi:RecB family endonuclease NucS
MTRVDDCLISTKGDETIKIFISEVLQYQEMTNWSDHKKVIRRTERDLVNKITSSLDELLQIKIIERFNEFKTPVGPVDVVGIDINGLYHIIEVKRGKATIGGCSQILRYSDYFNTINVEHKAYIMCPKITTGVGRFIASNHRLSWKEVDY